MKRGFTLVEVMIVVAIIVIVIAMTSVNLVRSKIQAIEANAQATLKAISAALESYAGANQGRYPSGSDLSVLYEADPKYLNKDYVADCTAESPCQGYSYSCVFSVGGYVCRAVPHSNYGSAGTYQIDIHGNVTRVE